MENYILMYSGAIRFDEEMNFGIYVYVNEEDPTDIVPVVKYEKTGTVIYPTE